MVLGCYYLYCIGPCCKPVHISLLVLLHIIIEGIPYFHTIASMSDCNVCRLESVIVIRGFRVDTVVVVYIYILGMLY